MFMYHIIRTVQLYDTYNLTIWYVSMYCTINDHLRYKTFCTWCDMYSMIHIVYCMILTIMQTPLIR